MYSEYKPLHSELRLYSEDAKLNCVCIVNCNNDCYKVSLLAASTMLLCTEFRLATTSATEHRCFQRPHDRSFVFECMYHHFHDYSHHSHYHLHSHHHFGSSGGSLRVGSIFAFWVFKTGSSFLVGCSFCKIVMVEKNTSSGKVPLEVLAVSEDSDSLTKPCVDCGQVTGCFCDFCLAQDRLPNETWVAGQHTPFCTTCDRAKDMCHFCRGLSWCAPPQWN